MKGFIAVLFVFSLLQVCYCSYINFEDARGILSATSSQRIRKRHTQDPATPEVDNHTKTAAGAPHINAISGGEDKESEEIGTDYDFVLNLDEKEDFDRLLTLLSRSGPAKHSDEASVGVSSTFIDRHDELHEDFPRPENSVFDQLAAGQPELASGSNDESSEIEDPEKKRIDAEQKKLEELYFKNFEMDEQPREKRMDAVISASSISSASVASGLLPVLVFLKYYLLMARM
ncbi:hypothetical protein FHG87_004337 [Trinorchestia longiramus]|nr:hypothetical protein FHG87_004337 [Trinorchestia longiramus]